MSWVVPAVTPSGSRAVTESWEATVRAAASKAFVAHLGEGIRNELLGEPDLAIDVSVILPGYIRSEMNDKVKKPMPFMVDTVTGTKAIAAAIQARKPYARVPAWPWRPMGTAMRHLPLKVVRRLG